MSYDRDDYMRRQEADHDLIRMRTPPPGRDFIGERIRYSRRTAADLNEATNAAILAMGGNLSRADARRIARYVGEALGLEFLS